jgi:hypothetical protein
MRQRSETVEHPFGTLKTRMAAPRPSWRRRCRRLAAEMPLYILDYNLTRVMSIMGIKPLIGA